MSNLETWAGLGSAEKMLVRRLDPEKMPRHVAVIMDGNGRWATARNRPRVEGHREGVSAVRETIETASRLGLEVLTLYAFSVENWNRPKYEIWTLMNLLKEYVRKELEELIQNNVKLQVLGRWRELDPSVVRLLERASQATSHCDGMHLNIALNYSGRCEIVDACRRIVTDWAQGKGADIDEETLGRYLYSAGDPDPDLLIRTSGEMRLSNFLLWQVAYTEILVTDVLWPDFNRRHFLEAVLEYQSRNRRFGRVQDSKFKEPAVSEA